MDPTAILAEMLGKNATGGGILDSILRGGRTAPKAAPAPRAPRPAPAPTPAPQQRRGGGGLGSIFGDLLGGGQSGHSAAPQAQAPAASDDPFFAELDRVARERGIDLGDGDQGGFGDVFRRPAPKAAPAPAPTPRPAPRAPSREVADQATLLIRAMCNAAKVDGQIEQAEQDAILGRLNNAGREEVDFIRKEINTPLDLEGFIRSVPASLAQQVYTFSVIAINIDTVREGAYLGRLAQGLGLDNRSCNQIHQQIGIAPIFGA